MRRWVRRRAQARRVTAVVALAAVSVLAAGCGDDGDEKSNAEPTQRAKAPVAETGDVEPVEDGPGDGEGEERLSPPDEPEPDIDLTGPVEEIERIYREQDAYRAWLFSHPDPANVDRLARITHRECPCWESDRKLLAHYAEHHLWWTGGDGETEISEINVVEQPTAHLVRLHVIQERDGIGELVDDSGEVHDRLPQARGKQEVLMRRGTFDRNDPYRDRSDDPWKVINVRDLEYEELPDSEEG